MVTNRPICPLWHLRFTLEATEVVRLPRMNKGITLRGAFGTSLRNLVCADKAASCESCRIHPTCPYGFIFAPRAPADAERLRLNRDIPRPFVIKPPLDEQEIYEKGEAICFDLITVGKARDFLPYFLVSFRELGERGIGAGRGRFEIARVETMDAQGHAQTIYHQGDSMVRVPDSIIQFAEFSSAREDPPIERVTIRFLTPVLIKYEGRWARPAFGSLMRRLRDRIQALSYFYCGETMSMDFRAFGETADRIQCVQENLRWLEESRYSKHRDLRHTHKGFVGSLSFHGELRPFLPFLRIGEYVHVGKAAVFGQGWYQIERHKP